MTVDAGCATKASLVTKQPPTPVDSDVEVTLMPAPDNDAMRITVRVGGHRGHTSLCDVVPASGLAAARSEMS